MEGIKKKRIMKKLLILFLTIASLYGYAQVPALNDIVRTNTLSPAKVANALDGSKSFIATGTDTYAITTNLNPYPGVVTYAVGDMYTVNFTNANTSTTVTLNVDGEGVVSIKDNEGNDLAIGDIKAGGTYKVRFNGTNFRIIGSIGGIALPLDATDIADGSVTNTEFQYINDLTSDAQTQIDGKQAAFGAQTATHVLAGPTPSFRALVTEDMSPALTANRTVTTASATIQADNLNIVYLDAASPEDFTIDQLTDDSQVILVNKGAATWTLIDGVGVTSSGSTTVESGEMAVIIYDTSTEPIVFGGGSAVDIADITGMGTGVDDFLVTPSSANLRTALTDENGTGAALFNGATTPDFTTGFTIGTAAASRKMMVGNGTNFVPSTETWAVPGTSGNVLVSDGTNWTSSAGSGLYWLLASGGARTGNQTLSGNVLDTYSGTFTGGSDVTPIRGMYFNKSVTQVGSAIQKEADLVTIEGLLTGSGGGNTQKLFGLTVKPTQSSSTGYFGWIRGLDPVSSADAFRFGKPQTVPTSTANNFEFLGGTSGATSLTLQVATGSISFSASSAANIVFRSGTGTSNQVDFGFGSTSIFSARAAANISSGRGKVVATDGVNASSTATQMSSFASHFEGSFWTGVAEQKQRAHMILEASTGTNGLGWLRTYAGSGFAYATVIQSMNLTNGHVGYAVAVPTARMHVAGSGTTTGQTLLLEASDGTDKFAFVDNGDLQVDKTITAGGTTGDRTINKLAGTVNFAAAATSITVTNSLVTANSIIIPVVRTNDTTATIKNVVPGAGSFVITLNAAATAETSVGFFIIN